MTQLAESRWTRFAVLDQLVLSGSNFLSLVILARALSPHEFGVFVLCFATIAFANGIQTALITQPHNVLGSVRVGSARYGAYTRSTAAAQGYLLLALLLILVLGGSALVLSGVLGFGVVIGLAVALVGWQAQEFGRRVLYSEGRLPEAVISDVLSYGGQVVVLATLAGTGTVSVAAALWTIGATSVVGFAFAAARLGTKIVPLADRSFLQENWGLGRWLFGASIAYWCSTDLFVFVAAVLLGVTVSGGFKAAQALLGPLNILLIFLGTNLPILFARTAASEQRKARLGAERSRAVRAALVVVLLYGLLLTLAARPLLVALYGAPYGQFALLVPLFVGYYAVATVASVYGASLTAQLRPDRVFRANVVGAVFAVVVGWPLVIALGVDGAVLAMLGSRGVQAIMLRRAARQVESVGAAVTGERTVVLFSYHYFESKRKAGFHWLAEAYSRLGWRVVFVTAPISRLSQLMGDYRFEYPVVRERGRLKAVRGGISSYVFFTAWHPANLRAKALNAISRPLVTLYGRTPLGGLRAEIEGADLVVFESTAALVLASRVRRVNPRAKLVYRVSDDLERVRVHPAIVSREEEISRIFDLVSVPSPVLYARFAHMSNAEYRPHGVWYELFDEAEESPYTRAGNACFVGNSDLDLEFIEIAAHSAPHVTFHLIGELPTVDAPNVVSHGELPFAETVPYTKFADVGLQCIKNAVHGETRASLKTAQFAYCGLPIVSPNFLPEEFPRTFAYVPGDVSSIEAAFRRAVEAGRGPSTAGSSWLDVADAIASHVAALPRPDESQIGVPQLASGVAI